MWQREDASGGHKQISCNYQILLVWNLTARAEITLRRGFSAMCQQKLTVKKI